jgi:hypothetical protein
MFGGAYTRVPLQAEGLQHNEAKVAVYNSLVLSVLLYGSESWAHGH